MCPSRQIEGYMALSEQEEKAKVCSIITDTSPGPKKMRMVFHIELSGRINRST